MTRKTLLVLGIVVPLFLNSCAAMVGAGAAGGAYEYQNKEQLEALEKDFQAGNISRKEYLERKEQIEQGSIIY